MGIEGGSGNSEINNGPKPEEIQQQAEEHRRSGEELEANPTIDNQGEKDQIQGPKEEEKAKNELGENGLEKDDDSKENAKEKTPENHQENQPQVEQNTQNANNQEARPQAETEQQVEGQKEQNPETQKEQSPETQKEQSPETQKEQTPETQKEQNPETQKEQSPETQKEQSPEIQKEQSPETQKEQTPETQKEQSPETQKEQSPETQKEQNPETQKEQSPETQKEQTPETQKEQNPETQKEQSLETQKEQTPETQKEQNPETQKEQNIDGQQEKKTSELGEKLEPADNERIEKSEANTENKESNKPELGEEGTLDKATDISDGKESVKEKDDLDSANLDTISKEELPSDFEAKEKREELGEGGLEKDNSNQEINKGIDSQESQATDKPAEEKKWEDLSLSEMREMVDNPETKDKALAMMEDYKERWSAEARGMSVEEYRDYKAALARAEKGETQTEGIENSEAMKNADQVLDKFQKADELSSDGYMTGAKENDLLVLSDKNAQVIKELKDARHDINNEFAEVKDQIASMNYDGTNESNPEKYKALCDQYYALEAMGEKLDYAVVKMDMNNWDISNVTKAEYHNEGTKRLDKGQIDKAFSDAQATLDKGVSSEASIKEAYRLGQKLEHDVMPSIDASAKEALSRKNVAEAWQSNYLKENNCTHEEAMAHPSGEYARNEQWKESIDKELAGYAEQMTDAGRLVSSLKNELPVSDSNCTMKVTDTHDGKLTIEMKYDNGGAYKSEHEGSFHKSDVALYKNSYERTHTVVVGQNSDALYSQTDSLQYRGLAYKREDTWGGDGVKVKNVNEGGFGNINISYTHNTGIDGKKPSVSIEGSASLAQLKDTVSVISKSDKEYKILSGEVSAMKASASAKADVSGSFSVKASSHMLGGEASVGVGNLTIGKASGSIGEHSWSKSNLDLLNTPKAKESGTSDGSEKPSIEVKGSASIGNGTTLGKVEYKNGEVSTKTVADTLKKDISQTVEGLKDVRIDVDTKTIQGIQKDIKAVQDIKDGKLGTDVSQKGDVVLGNSALKEGEKPSDFATKDVRDSESKGMSDAQREVSGELKESLKAFEQSNWNQLDVSEKKAAIGKLAETVANDLGLENRPDVRYYQSDKPGDFGRYSASENAIEINENSINDGVETADTIAHESRHCWQHEYAEKSDSPLAQEFKENFEHYTRPEINYERYESQPVEKDARDYASDICGATGHQEPRVDTGNGDVLSENKGASIKELSPERGAVFEKNNLPQDLESKFADVKKLGESIHGIAEFNEAIKPILKDPTTSPTEKMEKILDIYNNIPSGQRTNINVVDNAKALRTDAKSIQGGIDGGYLCVAFTNAHGLDQSKPIEGIIEKDASGIVKDNVPTEFYRRGTEGGNNLTSKMPDGSIPDTNLTAVPYKENSEAMHCYSMDKSAYVEAIDVISDKSMSIKEKTDALNGIRTEMEDKYKLPHAEPLTTGDVKGFVKDYQKFENSSDTAICIAHGADAKYGVCGTVAPMYVDDDKSKEKLYDGGAPQYNTPGPLSIYTALGVIREEK